MMGEGCAAVLIIGGGPVVAVCVAGAGDVGGTAVGSGAGDGATVAGPLHPTTSRVQIRSSMWRKRANCRCIVSPLNNRETAVSSVRFPPYSPAL